MADVEISIAVAGKSPLLMNRFTDAAQIAATAGTSETIVGDRGTPHEQAEAALYVDENGVIGVPQPNLLRSLIDAGKFFKLGKSKVTTQKNTIVTSCVTIDGLWLPLLHTQPWKVDTRPVRNPATGGRFLRHRPCFDDWRLELIATLDTSIMSISMFRDLVDTAGKRIGLGDYRVDCKGPFGKYVVEMWDSINGK